MKQKTFGLRKGSNQNRKKHRHNDKGSFKGFGRHHNKSNANTLQTPELVWQKYDNLLERHLVSRRKYYDYFNRADPHKRIKMENNFYATLEHLRRFESSLSSQQKKWLEQKTNNLQPDIIYSKNHEIPPHKSTVDPSQANPHLLSSQKQSDFSNDNEQSVGTMEDYMKLKQGH